MADTADTPATTDPNGDGNDTTTDAPDATSEEEVKDPAAVLRSLRAVREEKKAIEAELSELRAWRQEQERANETELERLARERDEAVERAENLARDAQAQAVRNAVISTATAAGAVRPDAVVRLVDLSAVQFDDNGQPVGVAELIAQIREDVPELFTPSAPAPGEAGAGRNAGPGESPNDRFRRALLG